MSMREPLHPEPHPQGHAAALAALADPTADQIAGVVGATIVITRGRFEGRHFTVKDWWDRVGDEPWKIASITDPPVFHANPLAAAYARRVDEDGLPDDDEVVYGNLEAVTRLSSGRELPRETAALVHVSELS